MFLMMFFVKRVLQTTLPVGVRQNRCSKIKKILELGQQAAASGFKEAMNSPNSTVNVVSGGVSFRLYVDKSTGLVRNFHPS